VKGCGAWPRSSPLAGENRGMLLCRFWARASDVSMATECHRQGIAISRHREHGRQQ
jgi:hypothetical protein